MTPLQLSSEQDAAINLPQSVFQQINDSENVGVFFGRYEAATLFPVDRGNIASSVRRQAQVCSRVLAATIGQNVSIQNLEEPVTVLLRLQSKEGMVRQSKVQQIRCVMLKQAIKPHCSSLHLVQRDVSVGTLTFKTGLHRAAIQLLEKTES